MDTGTPTSRQAITADRSERSGYRDTRHNAPLRGKGSAGVGKARKLAVMLDERGAPSRLYGCGLPPAQRKRSLSAPRNAPATTNVRTSLQSSWLVHPFIAIDLPVFSRLQQQHTPTQAARS